MYLERKKKQRRKKTFEWDYLCGSSAHLFLLSLLLLLLLRAVKSSSQMSNNNKPQTPFQNQSQIFYASPMPNFSIIRKIQWEEVKALMSVKHTATTIEDCALQLWCFDGVFKDSSVSLHWVLKTIIFLSPICFFLKNLGSHPFPPRFFSLSDGSIEGKD